MPILNSKTLPKDGPYIEFAALPAPVEIDVDGWPERSLYKDHVFFELGVGLTDTLCSVSRSYLSFDPYEFTQLETPDTIYAFASNILVLASRVAACPIHYFTSETSIYEGSTVSESCKSTRDLKADLIQTLLFIGEQSAAAAAKGKCLAIIGI